MRLLPRLRAHPAARFGLLILLAVGAGLAVAKIRPVMDRPSLKAGYVPGYEIAAGEELVLVFIGASFCGAQKREGFPELLEQAKLALAGRARTEGHRFRAIGVSLDWKVAEGLAFMEKFGEFDEVAAGSNWMNVSALRYVWQDLPGDPAVPQVILLRRRVESIPAINVQEERVVRRIIGTEQIMAWASKGAPL